MRRPCKALEARITHLAALVEHKDAEQDWRLDRINQAIDETDNTP